ncbi:hypothetical protein MMC29_006787 [Sticta canariensis]|nr:hypothetical protein [Sticta canariensis]
MSQPNSDIEEYVRNTLIEQLEAGNLSVGDSKIIFTIQDALLANAQGMFLWVAFQIESLCFQKTDDAILTALDDLPKDLPDTFNRILRKLQHSDAADSQLCRTVFHLVAAAQRPLTLDELRVAVSVEPGKTSWDASKLVNDMLRLLLDSCGSLVTIDEEYSTVHFAHHSVKQHLLSKSTDSDTSKYHLSMNEADMHLGEIIVTYLNFGIFDRQLAKVKSPMLPNLKEKNYPSAILRGSLSQSNIANRWAVKLLKNRGDSGLDIPGQLKAVAGIVDGSKEQTQAAHLFLPYAKSYWLLHTKAFKPDRVAEYALWEDLMDKEVETIELPWAPEKWKYFGHNYMTWIIQNEHWALINRNVDAQCEEFGTALHLASMFGCEKIARLLLENGADVNANAAFYLADRLIFERHAVHSLKNKADVNAKRRTDGIPPHALYTALQIAVVRGHEKIVMLLLENEASVDEYTLDMAKPSNNGNANIVKLIRNAWKSNAS